jgi:penicillin-binding protein 1A
MTSADLLCDEPALSACAGGGGNDGGNGEGNDEGDDEGNDERNDEGEGESGGEGPLDPEDSFLGASSDCVSGGEGSGESESEQSAVDSTDRYIQ